MPADLTGQTYVVTGGTSGVGLAAATQLAEAGARVVLTARDRGRGDAAAAWVRARTAHRGVERLTLDLADLSSVQAAAEELEERLERLDVLVNNAGVMATPYQRTVDGFELQFGINHLGHFALTGQLLPLLGAAERPRVVTVSSNAHHMGRVDFDNLEGERGYSKWRAYGQSKLANLLFTLELQRRADAAGWPLVAPAAHPGYAATDLHTRGRRMRGTRAGVAVTSAINRIVGQSAEAGAWPTTYAATSPEVSGGDFVGPSGPGQIRGRPRHVDMSAAAHDEAAARRLWDESVARTGVDYPELAAA